MRRERKRRKGPDREPRPSLQPSSLPGVREAEAHELENLETDNVHVKHIILLQNGKDLVNCRVVCLKTFFSKVVSRFVRED